MNALQKAVGLLDQMSSGEKTKLLQCVLKDLSGNTDIGIEKTIGVVGGEARIVRTRIAVWSLVLAKQLGATDQKILEIYPSLRPSDLAVAWSYYAVHKDEIDQLITENENYA